MTGEIIKSFLVGLGFDVDGSSLAKFNKAISSATFKVAALFGAMKATQAGLLYGITKISEGFEQMGYEYRIIAPAINRALALRRELLKAYAAAGVNIQKVIQSSVKLNFSLAKTKFAFEAIYRSVASRFFGLLTKQSDLLRQRIYANMPKIQAAIERFVSFVFRAVDAVSALVSRLWSILGRIYDAFVYLDQLTGGWSTKILAAVVAWRALNLAFIATPLGAIVTGLLAILALFDDFKTWQEGGKSLFNWTKFVPAIDGVVAALHSVWAMLQNIADAVGNLILGFYQLFKGDSDWAGTLKASVGSLWSALKNGGGALNNLSGGMFLPGALGVGGVNNSSSVSSQNLHQQTQITVHSTADAAAVGKSVANEQRNVNFDMTRNFTPATQ